MSKQTMSHEAWIKAEREKVKLEIIIDQIRELHYRTLDDPRCRVCWSETYPCPTIKALDGETDV